MGSDFESEVNRIKERVEESFREAEEELKRLRESMSFMHPREIVDELEDIVEDLAEDLGKAKRRLSDIVGEAVKRGSETAVRAAEDVSKVIREGVERFVREYAETVKKLAEHPAYTSIARGRAWRFVVELPMMLVRSVGRELEGVVRPAVEELKRTAESVVTTIVSSIRLREEDIKIIDELVEAGIFRSRSEAVAYFTKKGIEASREWLEKVRENIKKIRELQEQVKRELGES